MNSLDAYRSATATASSTTSAATAAAAATTGTAGTATAAGETGSADARTDSEVSGRHCCVRGEHRIYEFDDSDPEEGSSDGGGSRAIGAHRRPQLRSQMTVFGLSAGKGPLAAGGTSLTQAHQHQKKP